MIVELAIFLQIKYAYNVIVPAKLARVQQIIALLVNLLQF